jgi:hypothetical protein
MPPAQILEDGDEGFQVVELAHRHTDHLHEPPPLPFDITPEQALQARVGGKEVVVEEGRRYGGDGFYLFP